VSEHTHNSAFALENHFVKCATARIGCLAELEKGYRHAKNTAIQSISSLAFPR